MILLERAEKVGAFLKKLESGAHLSPDESVACHEVTTEEIFGYSEAERCKRIDEIGECYKTKVDLLNNAA